MAANKLEVFGPVALTGTYTTNIIAPAVAGASAVGYTATATYIILRRIHISNNTVGAATFRLYKGASATNAAGTDLWYNKTVAANDAFDWAGQLRLEGTNGFLVGGASVATTLTFEAEGELGLV